eukprot:41675-Eustigmatos_ZCMA.PRE.1
MDSVCREKQVSDSIFASHIQIPVHSAGISQSAAAMISEPEVNQQAQLFSRHKWLQDMVFPDVLRSMLYLKSWIM